MVELFPRTIETERLRLEAIHRDSLETATLFEFYDICSSDPDIDEVTQYVTWDPHASPKETLEFVEAVSDKRDENEGTSYLIYPREGEAGAGEIAGGAGFGVDWEARTMTLGCWLRKRYWGRGYSGERAAAFMQLAFEVLDLELVAATADVANEKSNVAIERYTERHGGGRDGLVRNGAGIGDEPADVYRYTVSRDAYLESDPQKASVRFPGFES